MSRQWKEYIKIAACILVPTAIFIGVMCWAASSYFANRQADFVSHAQHDSDGGIEDGRFLLIGIVVLAVLSGLGAFLMSGSYTRMLATFLGIGLLNFVVGNGLWNNNAPDPKDCLRFSLEFCGGLAVMDFVLLVIMAAFGWAQAKDEKNQNGSAV